MREHISNDNCVFVYIGEDGKEYESNVAINKIIWGNELVCQNCGGSISGDKCSGCENQTPVIKEGIVERSFLGSASVELEALLPEGAFIFYPPLRFEARYRFCSTTYNIDNWDTRFIFYPVKIYKRAIESPVTLYCKDVSSVSIKVLVKAEVILENRDWE